VHQHSIPMPHIFKATDKTPVREDISANLQALEDLHREFDTQLLLIESGGDNLAANYSRELADFIIYVVREHQPPLI
jgi:Ni2+-binding GTPase involved in maturation of urease and hydrogenase